MAKRQFPAELDGEWQRRCHLRGLDGGGDGGCPPPVENYQNYHRLQGDQPEGDQPEDVDEQGQINAPERILRGE